MGTGGYKTGGGGGGVKFDSYEKGRGAKKKKLVMLKGMHAQKVLGKFLCTSLRFSHIKRGETTSFYSLKKGAGAHKKFYPVLRGGGSKSFGPKIFPFCSPPPLPVNNDQSLI